MKKFKLFNKKYLAPLVVSFIVIATVSFASYSAPTAAPTLNNAFAPIDIGSEAQVKNGNLSVGAFDAANNALLSQQAIFNGVVTGSTATPSVLSIGDSTHQVSVNINDSMTSIKLQSDTLKSGGGLQPLCGGPNGELELCSNQGGGTGTDVCTNIPGLQTTVPVGYTQQPAGSTTCLTSNGASVIVTITPGVSSGFPYFVFTSDHPLNSDLEIVKLFADGYGQQSDTTPDTTCIPPSSASMQWYPPSGDTSLVGLAAGTTTGQLPGQEINPSGSWPQYIRSGDVYNVLVEDNTGNYRSITDGSVVNIGSDIVQFSIPSCSNTNFYQ